LNEVDHVDAAVLVATSPVDDQTKVRRDHLLLGFDIAGDDALGEFNLLFVVRQRIAVEVSKKQSQHVIRVGGGALGSGHRNRYQIGRHTSELQSP
jgi:hypothetical protein